MVHERPSRHKGNGLSFKPPWQGYPPPPTDVAVTVTELRWTWVARRPRNLAATP